MRAVMTVKESYLGILLFLVLSPILILLVPGLLPYAIIAIFSGLYVFFWVKKPRRRCIPCGQIVTLGPVDYIKALQNNLPCPRCESPIKNTHRT
jgi:hypothetical protein